MMEKKENQRMQSSKEKYMTFQTVLSGKMEFMQINTPQVLI